MKCLSNRAGTTKTRGVQNGDTRGFTLVEIIVSFAILAVVATAIAAAVVGIGGMQARDSQVRADNSTVEGNIASGQEPDSTQKDLALPLGDFEIDSMADTYDHGLGDYTILNEGEGITPPNKTLDPDPSADGKYSDTYTVLKTGYYFLEVWGASGGGSASSGSPLEYGGAGGYSYGYVLLKKGDTLYLHAGGRGSQSTSGGLGGLSDGGSSGGSGGLYTYLGASRVTGGGGAASDIRVNNNNLDSRIIVAGGGGGAGNDIGGSPSSKDRGGAGGGTSGVNGSGGSLDYQGEGGKQTRGGVAAGNLGGFSDDGRLGQGGSNNAPGGFFDSRLGGGGGGGWYGGGAGSQDAGGGGSGWVYTEQNYNAWKAGNAGDANRYTLWSDYYMIKAETVAGNSNNATLNPRNGDSPTTGNRGNGYVRVTWHGTDKP